jgi:hypothetical protein
MVSSCRMGIRGHHPLPHRLQLLSIQILHRLHGLDMGTHRHIIRTSSLPRSIKLAAYSGCMGSSIPPSTRRSRQEVSIPHI